MLRKLPQLNKDNSAFWQEGANGSLMIYHCDACKQYFHPPAPVCIHCLSDNVKPKKMSGRGSVASFTINHQKWHPDLEVPFVIAIIELHEQQGLRFVNNIIDINPEDVFIEMPVCVTFKAIEDVWLPLFKKES